MQTKAGDRVVIRKVEEIPDGLKAAGWDEIELGAPLPEDKSLPIDYEIEGVLEDPIQVGKSVVVFRDKRNGVKVLGIFNTSPVSRLGKNWFRTENSLYFFYVISS